MSDTPSVPSGSTPLAHGQFYQYQVPEVGTLITYASPDLVKRWGGLRPEAVVARATPGTVASGKDTQWTKYQSSGPFREFLHKVVAEVGPQLPEYQTAARDRGEGFVVVVDMRSPDLRTPPVEQADMIGAFKVKDGKFVEGGYQPNPQYRTVTENGPTLLAPPLLAKLMEAMEKLPPPASRAA